MINEIREAELNYFFITGTGRSGTMLLSRLFSLGTGFKCEHEQYFLHKSMAEFIELNDARGYKRDIESLKQANFEGSITNFGVSSGHMCFALPLVAENLGHKFKTFITVRPPVNFVRSALSRGFFDPSHPHYLEQIRPSETDPIYVRWQIASPFEKCLWYWNIVNNSLLDFLEETSPDEYKITNIEQLNLEDAIELCRFAGFQSINVREIKVLLAKKVNATPAPGLEIAQLNPYSLPPQLPDLCDWTDQELEQLDQYTTATRSRYSTLGSLI